VFRIPPTPEGRRELEGPLRSGGSSEILGVGGEPLRRGTLELGVGGAPPGGLSREPEGQL